MLQILHSISQLFHQHPLFTPSIERLFYFIYSDRKVVAHIYCVSQTCLSGRHVLSFKFQPSLPGQAALQKNKMKKQPTPTNKQ